MQVASNSRLCGMDVAEIVYAVDDPELFVAGRKVQNVFVRRQDNERGKATFGADRDDILPREFHRTAAAWFRLCRQHGQHGDTEHSKTAFKNGLEMGVHAFSPGLHLGVAASLGRNGPSNLNTD